MIEYIRGELAELTPALAVFEAVGVGYGLNISLSTHSAIQGRKGVELYVCESLVMGGRDDNFTFYGLFSKQERELYRLLITMSGMGASTVRTISSTLSSAELCNIITNGDEQMLKTIKGTGLKTAQCIVVDLRDRIVSSDIATELYVSSEPTTAVDASIRDETMSALTTLGFSPAPNAKVVGGISKPDPSLPIERVVKLALKQIK